MSKVCQSRNYFKPLPGIFSLVLYMYEKFKSMYYRKMIQKPHNSVEEEVFMNDVLVWASLENVPDLGSVYFMDRIGPAGPEIGSYRSINFFTDQTRSYRQLASLYYYSNFTRHSTGFDENLVEIL